jgi:streptomycin 6-kinase
MQTNQKFLSELPVKFRRNASDSGGESGERWLRDLPQVIEEIENKWSLKADKPFRNLSYNYVAPCRRADGREAVLKIALPFNGPEIFNEAKFLRLADGEGTVKLLAADETRRAILLEKLAPGENLREFCRSEETQAVEIAISIMRRRRRAAPDSDFPKLDRWFQDFFQKASQTKFPSEFQNKASEFYARLSAAPIQKFLLHGDLHHENILSAEREAFLAIDPKSIVGEVGYEIAVFLNNHLWWLASEKKLPEKLNAAVGQFSEAFEIEPVDLRKWAFSQLVLSAWWTFDENGENWEADLALAENWEV